MLGALDHRHTFEALLEYDGSIVDECGKDISKGGKVETRLWTPDGHGWYSLKSTSVLALQVALDDMNEVVFHYGVGSVGAGEKPQANIPQPKIPRRAR